MQTRKGSSDKQTVPPKEIENARQELRVAEYQHAPDQNRYTDTSNECIFDRLGAGALCLKLSSKLLTYRSCKLVSPRRRAVSLTPV
jgi:hypothetical protein